MSKSAHRSFYVGRKGMLERYNKVIIQNIKEYGIKR